VSADRFDAAIRELYLDAGRGPLRVRVSDDLAPHLRAGQTARLERVDAKDLRRGDLAGVRGPDGSVRLLRVLGRDGGAVLGLAGTSLLRVKPSLVLGRAVAVEADDGPRQLDVAATGLTQRAQLRWSETRARWQARRERLSLKAYLTRLYWDVNDSFMQGIPASGDILVTDRCPVGCRFCLYSCVPEGHDMPADRIAAVAREFRDAGVPRVRILGGEPFINARLALESFLAVRDAYPPELISVQTSGHWGGSQQQVASRLDPVADAGLMELHLSFDSFHLERFPIDNYRRILARAAGHGVECVMSVHYSTALKQRLPELLELKRSHPFTLRLLTVSREGRAELLSDAELSVDGVMDFRDQLLGEPGVEIRMEDSSCFRWTVFPDGELSFCCKQHPKNMVGNLERTPLADLGGELRRQGTRNRLRVARFALSYGGELSWNPCLSCPLKAHDRL
jgi:hypothetical protein